MIVGSGKDLGFLARQLGGGISWPRALTPPSPHNGVMAQPDHLGVHPST
jgi:hypothetical protein